ncbi:MAG: hypothetical protein HPY74_05670 [Firmicutes bacterium]|nr:hypothetical protein [Bacillota bacterium]
MKQRINMVVELESMSPEQSIKYINHQLDYAKSKTSVFDDKYYPLIHSISFGIPRRINQLCYRVIIGAYIDKMPIITADYIKNIVESRGFFNFLYMIPY